MITGALSRLAARRPVRGYQAGGEVDDEDDYVAPADDGDSQPQFGSGYTEALDDPQVAQGALSAVAQMPPENKYINQLGETAAAFPHGAAISGALNTNTTAIDQALTAKKQAIAMAMHNIATSGQGSANLPLLMASAGLLRPTRTGSFGESIGNAADAAAPEMIRERELDRQNAIQSGNLGVQAADVDTQIAQGHLSNFYKQIGLGEAADAKAATATYQEDTLRARASAQAAALKAGAEKAAEANAAKVTAAQIAADSRKAVAESYRSGRVDAATIAASKAQYLGPSTKDPNVGLYLNPHDNSVAEGPASAGKTANAANSKLVSDLQFMVNNGIAPDLSTAFAMRRAGVNDGATFQRLIQNEKKMLLGTPAGLDMTAAELENQAREMVVQRQPLAKAAGAIPTTAAAAAGAAPPAPAKPSGSAPPRPLSVPPRSAWSATRKMWKDPAGKIYDQSGKPVAAAAPIAPQVPNG